MKLNFTLPALIHAAMLVIAATIFTACSEEPDLTKKTPTEEIISFEGGETPKPVISSDGGQTTIYFTAAKPWTATVNTSRDGDDWISVSPTSGEAGNAEIHIITLKNESYDERNALVEIKCGGQSFRFTVTQKQIDAILMSSDKQEIDCGGGTINIDFEANVTPVVTIAEEDRSWIKAQAASRAMSPYRLTLEIAENEVEEPRVGTVAVKAGSREEYVKIYQYGSGPTVLLPVSEFVVGSTGEEIRVEVRSNTLYEIKMPSCTWVSEKSTRAFSSYTHYFTVAPNDTYDSRETEIIFVNKMTGAEQACRIHQVQKNAILVAADEYEVSDKAGRLDFTVNTNVEFEVTCSSSSSWIKRAESSRTRALQPVNLSFDIEENTTYNARTAIITIKSVDGSVTQNIKVVQRPHKKKIVEQIDDIIAFFHHDIFGIDIEDTAFKTAIYRYRKYEDGSTMCCAESHTGSGAATERMGYQGGAFAKVLWQNYTGEEHLSLKNSNFALRSHDLDHPYLIIEPGVEKYMDYNYIQETDDGDINVSALKLTAKPKLYFMSINGASSQHSYPYFTFGGSCDGTLYGTQSFEKEYGLMNMYMPYGQFTEEQTDLICAYFGRSADDITWEDIIRLTVDQLIDILHLRSHKNPYLELPAGLYVPGQYAIDGPSGFSLCYSLDGIIFTNDYFATARGRSDFEYYFWFHDYYGFYIDEYDGEKRMIPFSDEIGSFTPEIKCRVIENSVDRTMVETRATFTKEYRRANTASGFPNTDFDNYYGTNFDYPNFFSTYKYIYEYVDTIVDYKDRTDIPFRLSQHYDHHATARYVDETAKRPVTVGHLKATSQDDEITVIFDIPSRVTLSGNGPEGEISVSGNTGKATFKDWYDVIFNFPPNVRSKPQYHYIKFRSEDGKWEETLRFVIGGKGSWQKFSSSKKKLKSWKEFAAEAFGQSSKQIDWSQIPITVKPECVSEIYTTLGAKTYLATPRKATTNKIKK